MAGITLDQAEQALDTLMNAAINARGATTVVVAGRSTTYRNLSELNEAISFWDAMVKRLSRGGMHVRGVTPI